MFFDLKISNFEQSQFDAKNQSRLWSIDDIWINIYNSIRLYVQHHENRL